MFLSSKQFHSSNRGAPYPSSNKISCYLLRFQRLLARRCLPGFTPDIPQTKTCNSRRLFVDGKGVTRHRSPAAIKFVVLRWGPIGSAPSSGCGGQNRARCPQVLSIRSDAYARVSARGRWMRPPMIGTTVQRKRAPGFLGPAVRTITFRHLPIPKLPPPSRPPTGFHARCIGLRE